MPSDIGGARFKITADVPGFQKTLKQAETAAAVSSKRMQTQLDGIGKSSRGASMGLLTLSQAIDDAQYGFRAIVNNIPQMIYMFGGSAGIAGAVGITAVAVNILINHFETLQNFFKSQWLGVPLDQLEQLRIATEKAGEAFDKLMLTPSALAAKEIGALKEAMVEAQKGGPARVFKGLTEAVAADPGLKANMSPEDVKKRANLQGAIKIMQDPKHIRQLAEPSIDDLRAQIKALDESLNEQNRLTAKTLMGRALAGGEEGEGSRATIRRLIKEFANSFTPEFRKAVERAHPDLLEPQLEHDRAQRERAHSRDVASMILQGPLGTQLMLGADEAKPAGPAGRKALEAMMKPGARRFGKIGTAEMIEKMMKAGLTEEQARAVIGGMGPEAQFKAGKAFAADQGLPLGKFGELPGEAVRGGRDRLFAEQMKKAEAMKKAQGLEAKIGGAMGAAGAFGVPKDVLNEMKLQLKDRIKAIMLERGLTEAQARQQVLREHAMHAFPQAFQPAQFMGLLQFSKMIQIGALSGGGDIPKRSLDELVLIRKALMAPKAQVVAVAK